MAMIYTFRDVLPHGQEISMSAMSQQAKSKLLKRHAPLFARI